MVSISAIVINHNRKDLLLECLESLKAQTVSASEIILVDNASVDGSIELVRERFSNVHVVENINNRSFSASCNQGINLAQGEFVLLLNNDVVLDKHYLERLIGIIQKDERIGIAGGKILSADKVHIDSAGQFLARSRKVIDRGYKELERGQYNKSSFVFSIGASCALYRRSMLEGVREGAEYFDEDFEFFYEDMDLAWRSQRKGWAVYYEPRSVAYHKRGATAKTKKPFIAPLRRYYVAHLNLHLLCCAIRNRYLMILKNDSALNILRNFPFILWYEIKQACYLLLFRPATIICMVKSRQILKKSLQKRKASNANKSQTLRCLYEYHNC